MKLSSGNEGSAVGFNGLSYRYAEPVDHGSILREIQGWSEEFENAPGSATLSKNL
jgi:hypothetical protein